MLKVLGLIPRTGGKRIGLNNNTLCLKKKILEGGEMEIYCKILIQVV
jgi:hypothetical protein